MTRRRARTRRRGSRGDERRATFVPEEKSIPDTRVFRNASARKALARGARRAFRGARETRGQPFRVRYLEGKARAIPRRLARTPARTRTARRTRWPPRSPPASRSACPPGLALSHARVPRGGGPRRRRRRRVQAAMNVTKPNIVNNLDGDDEEHRRQGVHHHGQGRRGHGEGQVRAGVARAREQGGHHRGGPLQLRRRRQHHVRRGHEPRPHPRPGHGLPGAHRAHQRPRRDGRYRRRPRRRAHGALRGRLSSSPSAGSSPPSSSPRHHRRSAPAVALNKVTIDECFPAEDASYPDGLLPTFWTPAAEKLNGRVARSPSPSCSSSASNSRARREPRGLHSSFFHGSLDARAHEREALERSTRDARGNTIAQRAIPLAQ